MLAFMAVARAMLPINPEAGLSSFARQVGCTVRLGTELIEMGVIAKRAEGEGYDWKSTQTNEEIVDALIVHRRKQAAPSGMVPTEALESLRTKVASLEAFAKSTIDAFEGLKRRVEVLEAGGTAKLSDEDAGLLNLALNDDKNKEARIGALERNVGDILRKMNNIATGGAEGKPVPAPLVVRKWKIGLFGVHTGSLGFVRQAIDAMLGDRKRQVELVHLDHWSVPHRTVPHGLDAVIITPDGMKREREVTAVYPNQTHHVNSGGNKALADRVALIVGGAA